MLKKSRVGNQITFRLKCGQLNTENKLAEPSLTGPFLDAVAAFTVFKYRDILLNYILNSRQRTTVLEQRGHRGLVAVDEGTK